MTPLLSLVGVGYIVATDSTLIDADANGRLQGAILTSPTSQELYTTVAATDVNCGRVAMFGSFQTARTAATFTLELDRPTIEGAPEPAKTAAIRVRTPACPTVSTHTTSGSVHSLLRYDALACNLKTLSDMDLRYVSPTVTTTVIPTIVSRSTAIVWLSIGAVVGVGIICVALYFLCLRPRRPAQLTPPPPPQVHWLGQFQGPPPPQQVGF